MTKNKLKTSFEICFTFLVIIFLLFLGPANAIVLSLDISQSKLQYGELLTFNANIDINVDERLPLKNLSAIIKDENSNIVAICVFDIEGNKLNPCDSSFENISRILNNSEYNNGHLIGEGFGNSSTNPIDSIYTTDFGYGFGFDYFDSGNELIYEIKWRTPSTISNLAKIYTISIESDSFENNIDFTYKIQNPPQITVEMEKPVALTDKTLYIENDGETVFINASDSFDPNGLNLTSFSLFMDGNFFNSFDKDEFELNLDVGTYNMELVVTNELNITSLPYEFNITIVSLVKEENFELIVDPYINNERIKFKVVPKVEMGYKNFDLKPKIMCLNIPIELRTKNKFYSSSMNLKPSVDEYLLNTTKDALDMNLPLNINCDFQLLMVERDTGETVVLHDDVSFYDILPEVVNEELNHGNDLINYIFKAFDKEFSHGYNELRYTFVNDGSTDLDVYVRITISDLGIESIDDLVVPSNSRSFVTLPVFINANTVAGTYPVRISYRINNDGQLKTKYGYLKIGED
ncbi:MAG: hypothetical protein KC589_06800 [Nanoarchaeota archaeon]|nr:hypothetical protein [Nanoarchaeota archaeon]